MPRRYGVTFRRRAIVELRGYTEIEVSDDRLKELGGTSDTPAELDDRVDEWVDDSAETLLMQGQVEFTVDQDSIELTEAAVIDRTTRLQ